MKQEQNPVPAAPVSRWPDLQAAATHCAEKEPLLSKLVTETILGAADLPEAVARLLSRKLADRYLTEEILFQLFKDFAGATPRLTEKISRDFDGILAHDPAATTVLCPFLFFKGFHALQSYRLAHYLWTHDRKPLALYVQNRVSDLFGVDIHPGARIGCGIMMDHATGIVIGETAVVEDDVLFWHGVTLGGRDFAPNDRHPKIRKGAVLGAHSILLGNIEVGAGAKVAAGSIVVKDVPAGTTIAGAVARPLPSE